jgi:dTDP-glucose pyrophosphorylase
MIENLFINSSLTLKQAMKALNKTEEKCLLVVDQDKRLLGTLTDGDLRRSILEGSEFSKDISKSYNPNPIVLIKDKFSEEEAKNLLHNKKLDLIPIVNEDNFVVDYITWTSVDFEMIDRKLLDDVPVVIMAGGKGTRMEPFTKILPKPLVPINEKPIIEHIIERFNNVGCNEFHLTVNYKGRILKAYFEELQPDYKINFVNEQEPLGTAGSLRFLDGKINQPFFVTNCDIIIKSNYASIYEFHKKGDYDVSLVASAKEYIIPYGTCELNTKGHLSHINEKPHYNFLINTGLYVLNPKVLKLIPKNKFYHITHLIEKAKNKGMKIGVFPIDDDDWIDIGQWAEYKLAVEQLKS